MATETLLGQDEGGHYERMGINMAELYANKGQLFDRHPGLPKADAARLSIRGAGSVIHAHRLDVGAASGHTVVGGLLPATRVRAEDFWG